MIDYYGSKYDPNAEYAFHHIYMWLQHRRSVQGASDRLYAATKWYYHRSGGDNW